MQLSIRFAIPSLLLLSVATPLEAMTGEDEVTFNKDVAPIVYAKCMACHRDGEVAPFPLTNYEEVRKRARQIAMVTGRRIMPPWKPVAGHGEFKYDRSLTNDQIAVFSDWVRAGRPEGEPEDLPTKPKYPTGWLLGEPDLLLELAEPFPVYAEGKDIYVHFVFPLDLKAVKYVRAVQVRPSNPQVAHHGVILLDGTKKARELAKAEGGHYYLNAGDAGFAPRGFLPGYAPGNVTVKEDAKENKENDVGLTLDKGLDIVLQMHYHPTGREEMDRPRIGLYFTNQKPKRGPAIIAMANNDVDIPAGAQQFVRTDSFTLPADFIVRDIWAHMHLLGKKVKVWAELPPTRTIPTGKTKDLLLIDNWDFNWQDSYVYQQPFLLPAKTVVHAEWTWDNSAANIRNPHDPPQRVTWGPSSDDEMSGLIVGGVTVRPGWDEAVWWLNVLAHYVEIEEKAKQAHRARRERQGAP